MVQPRLILALLICITAHADDIAARYTQQLEKLDRTRPESTCQARTILRQWLPKADLNDRAFMFRAFRAFYSDLINRSTQRFDRAVEPVTGQIEEVRSKPNWNSDKDVALLSAQPRIHRAIGPWLDCGFSVSTEEGMWFPAVSTVAMLEFAPKLPSDLSDYVRFRSHEDAELVAGDAALGLTWRQLADRLKRWEDFASAHPKLKETDSEIVPGINMLVGMFLFGVDNTPTFDDGGRIQPDLIVAWREFVNRNPASRIAPLISELLPLLKRNGNRLTSSDHALFERYGLGEEFDGWLRMMQLRNPQ